MSLSDEVLAGRGSQVVTKVSQRAPTPKRTPGSQVVTKVSQRVPTPERTPRGATTSQTTRQEEGLRAKSQGRDSKVETQEPQNKHKAKQ